MKEFKAPEITVVHFDQKDVILTSSCACVECKVCPPESNDCPCYDFPSSNV